MKNKKKKNCQKGYSCGFTCISVYKVCLIEFPEGVSVALDRGASFRNQTGKPYEKPSLPAPKFTFQRDLGLPKKQEGPEKSDNMDPFGLIDLHSEKIGDPKLALKVDDVASHLVNKGVFDDEDTAYETVDTIRYFTRNGYIGMKEDERDGIDNPRVDIINNNIFNNDKIPTYDGEVWRGIYGYSEGLNENRVSALELIRTLSEGDEIQMDAMSSFSTNRKVAESFAEGGEEGALFRVSKNKTGKSIQGMSGLIEEKEVLVPKGVKYKVVGIQMIDVGYGKMMKVFDLEEV
jgi:hypothetical protein